MDVNVHPTKHEARLTCNVAILARILYDYPTPTSLIYVAIKLHDFFTNAILFHDK